MVRKIFIYEDTGMKFDTKDNREKIFKIPGTMNMQKYYTTLLITILLTGCSVYKAATPTGVNAPSLMACKDRDCLLSFGMKKVHQQHQHGKHIEIYRASSPQAAGNTLRAFAYFILDIHTFFLWEIIGTSVENEVVKEQKYILLQATFPNATSSQIEKIQLYDSTLLS